MLSYRWHETLGHSFFLALLADDNAGSSHLAFIGLNPLLFKTQLLFLDCMLADLSKVAQLLTQLWLG